MILDVPGPTRPSGESSGNSPIGGGRGPDPLGWGRRPPDRSFSSRHINPPHRQRIRMQPRSGGRTRTVRRGRVRRNEPNVTPRHCAERTRRPRLSIAPNEPNVAPGHRAERTQCCASASRESNPISAPRRRAERTQTPSLASRNRTQLPQRPGLAVSRNEPNVGRFLSRLTASRARLCIESGGPPRGAPIRAETPHRLS